MTDEDDSEFRIKPSSIEMGYLSTSTDHLSRLHRMAGEGTIQARRLEIDIDGRILVIDGDGDDIQIRRKEADPE